MIIDLIIICIIYNYVYTSVCNTCHINKTITYLLIFKEMYDTLFIVMLLCTFSLRTSVLHDCFVFISHGIVEGFDILLPTSDLEGLLVRMGQRSLLMKKWSQPEMWPTVSHRKSPLQKISPQRLHWTITPTSYSMVIFSSWKNICAI